MPEQNPPEGQTAQPPKKAPEPVEETPAPNIRYVGKKEVKNSEGKFETVAGTPPKYVILAGKKFKLPSAEEQKAGFYHEDALRIKRALPDEFKTPEDKGGAK